VVAYLLYTNSLKAIEGSIASNLTTLEAITVAVICITIDHEKLLIAQMIGSVFILSSILIILYSRIEWE